MRSSVRYSIAVYAGLLLAGSIVVPPPTPSRGDVPEPDWLLQYDAESYDLTPWVDIVPAEASVHEERPRLSASSARSLSKPPSPH